MEHKIMAFIPKKYFYDKTILLLMSVLTFLFVVTLASIALRLGSGQSVADYFVEYRSNAGISAFKTGGIISIISFILFAVLIFASSCILSIRTYLIKRELSFSVLILGSLLLLLSAVVSNALLALR